jgi:hypothetical protein
MRMDGGGEVWNVVKEIAYKFIKDEIASGLDDDVFPPQDVSVEISSADFHWGDGTKLSPEATVVFRGHNGLYHLTYFWEIKTVEKAFSDNRRKNATYSILSLISGFTISGPCSVRRMEVQSITLDNNGMNLGPERDAV